MRMRPIITEFLGRILMRMRRITTNRLVKILMRMRQIITEFLGRTARRMRQIITKTLVKLLMKTPLIIINNKIKARTILMNRLTNTGLINRIQITEMRLSRTMIMRRTRTTNSTWSR